MSFLVVLVLAVPSDGVSGPGVSVPAGVLWGGVCPPETGWDPPEAAEVLVAALPCSAGVIQG